MVGGEATAGNISRNRSPSKMTKYVECWGADKPFANITESTLAKNIGLTVSNEKLFYFVFGRLDRLLYFIFSASPAPPTPMC